MVFYDPQQFLERLLETHNEGDYLFRGITEASFPLVPQAFRENYLKEHSELFPHSEVTIGKWFLKVVNDIKTSGNKVLASTPPFFLNRICRLLIQILQYNYAIYNKYHSGDYPKNCNDERLINIFKLGSDGHWAKEKTFKDFFEIFHLSLVTLFSLDEKLIKEPYVFEEITGFDESYPQQRKYFFDIFQKYYIRQPVTVLI